MRRILGLGAAALLAAVGAVVLGEYDLRGTTAFVGGPLFGVAVCEVAVSVARRGDLVIAVGTALLASLGLTWALWISTNHFRNPIAPTAMAMVGLGAVAAFVWGLTSRGRSQPAEAPAVGD